MRKRKIIIVGLLVVLLGGAAVLFLYSDSGPTVRVIGNLSPKDVAQIKTAVRCNLWHDALPSFSWQTFTALPGAAKRAWTSHVRRIEGNEHQATAFLGGPKLGGTNVWQGYDVTNGPAGWACIHPYTSTFLYKEVFEVRDITITP